MQWKAMEREKGNKCNGKERNKTGTKMGRRGIEIGEKERKGKRITGK